MSGLRAPFPWFGSKRTIAPAVWRALGDVDQYIEPFAGSLAVLLASPRISQWETVCDANHYIANFWRAVARAPDAVAGYADWPISEIDMHARHRWLVARDEFRASMLADPEFFDVKIAGWWLWGQSTAIPGNWLERKGLRASPHLTGHATGQGIHRAALDMPAVCRALSERLRRVRVVCGDWTRATSDALLKYKGTTAVFLDPPYSSSANRDMDCYGSADDGDVASRVREWAIAHGDDPTLRIALCGYDGEHEMPESWARIAWSTSGGLAKTSRAKGKARGMANRHRERIWLSPRCLSADGPLFATGGAR